MRVVVTSAIKPSNFEVSHFIQIHGDGVKRWALKVKDVRKAYDAALNNGAIPVRTPKKIENDNGFVEEAAIKLYDDAEIVFINRENYKGIFKPGFGIPPQKINVAKQKILV
jgi:4-hydroxyphenylpyruvate dioxygenase